MKETWDLQRYQKQTPTQVFFYEIYKIFKNTYFYKTSSMASSENIILKSLNALLIEL